LNDSRDWIWDAEHFTSRSAVQIQPGEKRIKIFPVVVGFKRVKALMELPKARDQQLTLVSCSHH
jgi:hypothetical protein